MNDLRLSEQDRNILLDVYILCRLGLDVIAQTYFNGLTEQIRDKLKIFIEEGYLENVVIKLLKEVE